MKILITGGKGMLGRTLEKEFSDHEIIVADLPDWDITDDDAIVEKICNASPDVVIHCAAMTKVDDCESNKETAFKINEDGSRNIALACKICGARLIAISTDYVFSGNPPQEPWAWGEGDMTMPATVYGQSKLAGERMITMLLPNPVIVRIAWLYGAGGPSFVHTMAKLGGSEGDPLKVVNDQRGNPTSCKTVADAIRFIISRPDIAGVVHATCEEACTWYDFACEIKSLLGDRFKRAILPCSTEEFPRPAPRPKNSALKKSVLNVNQYRTPSWKDALKDFILTEFLA
jgi:dTDP-4-dehydrorhamnose reductase